MSESIWWPDESWWERKVLPLGFATLSFRQLATMMISFLTAFMVSLPFEFAIAGASFGGRAAVFCIVFGIGYMISSRRVKLLPIELQAFYFLRTEGISRVRMKLDHPFGSKKQVIDPPAEIRRPSAVQEISVEDFKNPIPLTISDALKGIQKETRVLLFLDEQVRGEGLVSPQRPRYRLTYVPLQDDVGKHLLTVRLDGSTSPLVSVDLLVQGRSAEVGESITKVNDMVLTKKPSTRPRPPVLYELRSVNLANLPEKEQASVLDRFASFLDSLTEPITFHVVQDEREVEAIGALYHIPYKRFFVETHSQVDSLVQKLGTRMVRVHTLPQIRPAAVSPRYIVDSEGHYVQTYCITRLGGTLVPGFLAELYQLAYSIMVDIDPIDIYEAKKMVRSYARSVGSRLLLRQTEGRSLDPEEQAEFQRASGAAQLIGAGKERLFRTRIRIVLRVNGYKELVEARKKLRQLVGGMVGQVDSPAHLQEALLSGVGPKYVTGRWFFITTSGALSLFPFCGLDVVDPSGVFLGQNLQTGNGILYDVFEKENYNVALMGQSGFGKSTFVKTYLGRMLNQDPDMMVFLFDSIVRPEYALGPDGRYETSFAGITGCKVHRFGGDKGAGLDPFAIFPSKRVAANFLASVAKVENDPDLLADLYLTSEKASNVNELIEMATGDLKKRLLANLPPYRFLFEGETEIYPRMVFVLYDLPPGELRDAAAFLALSAVWKKIQDTDTIPISRRKAIVVDEGWSLVEINPRTGRPYFPLAVEYVPEIARTGRHYNAAFVVATQLVSDLMGRGGVYGPGRIIIESCSTKIVLKQDQAATQVLKEAFNLSDGEEKFIVNAKIGQGILVTQEGRIPFYNFLSDEERRLFTTKPKEVTA